MTTKMNALDLIERFGLCHPDDEDGNAFWPSIADEKLIKAAPALLEALGSARFVLVNRANADLPEWEQYAVAALEDIDAAIAAATK